MMMMMMDTMINQSGNMKQSKQVIIIRKDLKCRRGKEISQGAHASMSFLTKRITSNPAQIALSVSEVHWLQNSFRKITCCVDSENELLQIHQRALDLGLESHLITDSGFTEFNGVPTNTAVAIGPDWEERINPVTQNLKLY